MRGDGDCFEVAGNLTTNLINCDCYLCHGKPIGQGKIDGIKHNHAWIEVNDIVIDFSNGKKTIIPRERYYRIGKINKKEVFRYTPIEAVKMMLETAHFGPWEK